MCLCQTMDMALIPLREHTRSIQPPEIIPFQYKSSRFLAHPVSRANCAVLLSISHCDIVTQL
jgi:hypothetical protein